MSVKHYENEALGVAFALPEKPTVRQMLAFRSGIILRQSPQDTIASYWEGFLALVQDWQCERLPDPQVVDLDAETSVKIADIIMWCANTAAGHTAQWEQQDPN